MGSKESQWQSHEKADMFLSHPSNISECILIDLAFFIALQIIEKGIDRLNLFHSDPLQ
jgi:hypothetical protein